MDVQVVIYIQDSEYIYYYYYLYSITYHTKTTTTSHWDELKIIILLLSYGSINEKVSKNMIQNNDLNILNDYY